MRRSTYESIKIDRFIFGSTVPFYPTGLVEENGKRSTLIQTSNFSCAESNAYMTNTLLPRVLHVSYFCHAYTACFDLLEQNGGKSWKLWVQLATKARNILA